MSEKDKLDKDAVLETFVPDYLTVSPSIQPLENIMKCGIKDADDKERRNVSGLFLLCHQWMKQDEKTF